ncbi:MAG: hypothetical protein K9M11_03850 [Candidatus Pacebacteria bacterium]|nr:hypothetical protein [Candidatus Paceibacterota bacterium]
MKIHKMSQKTNMRIKRILSSFGLFAIATGFIFATPNPIVKNEITLNAIRKIEAQNKASLLTSLASPSIAYAQDYYGEDPSMNNPEDPSNNEGQNNEPPADVWGCMDSSALNFNSDATSDDGSCDYSAHCYDENALNYQASEDCVYQPEDVYGCTDPTAPNYDYSATVDNGSCQSYGYICCDGNATNYAPQNSRGVYDICVPETCTFADPICCDGNWDTYVPPSARGPEPYTCDYGPTACGCTDYHTSQCDNTNSGDACNINIVFSVTKSGVAIAGTAKIQTVVCATDAENTLRGQAVAGATPATPLNVPQTIDSFSSYTVTSKDYCLNVSGVQGSPAGYDRNAEGFCCANPDVVDTTTGNSCIASSEATCGSATASGPYETAPMSDLCAVGVPGTVSESDTSYSWECSTGSSNTSCSAGRTCNGGSCVVCTDYDCGTDDMCVNYQGPQDNSYLSNNNLFSDSARYCWNSISGACGTSYPGPVPVDGPTTNLCISPSTVSSAPTFNTTTQKWEWTCQDSNNNPLYTPSVCDASPCTGSECTTASNNLIQTFIAQPSIVSASDKFCSLSWVSNIDANPDADQLDVCKLNNSPTYYGRDIYDDNPTSTGLDVPPGSYSLTCSDSNGSSQTKSVKCIVKPNYKEI